MHYSRVIIAGAALTFSSVFGGMAVKAGGEIFDRVNAATSCGNLTPGECAAEEAESTTDNGQPQVVHFPVTYR